MGIAYFWKLISIIIIYIYIVLVIFSKMCKKARLFATTKKKTKGKNVNLFSTIPKPTLDIIRFKYKVRS